MAHAHRVWWRMHKQYDGACAKSMARAHSVWRMRIQYHGACAWSLAPTIHFGNFSECASWKMANRKHELKENLRFLKLLSSCLRLAIFHEAHSEKLPKWIVGAKLQAHAPWYCMRMRHGTLCACATWYCMRIRHGTVCACAILYAHVPYSLRMRHHTVCACAIILYAHAPSYSMRMRQHTLSACTIILYAHAPSHSMRNLKFKI